MSKVWKQIQEQTNANYTQQQNNFLCLYLSAKNGAESLLHFDQCCHRRFLPWIHAYLVLGCSNVCRNIINGLTSHSQKKQQPSINEYYHYFVPCGAHWMAQSSLWRHPQPVWNRTRTSPMWTPNGTTRSIDILMEGINNAPCFEWRAVAATNLLYHFVIHF